MPGTRAIIWLDIHQVGTSCGYSVPNYDFKSYRRVLEQFSEKKEKADQAGDEEDNWDRYWAYKNAKSVDGLPGLARGVEIARRDRVAPIEKFVGISECYLQETGRWREWWVWGILMCWWAW